MPTLLLIQGRIVPYVDFCALLSYTTLRECFMGEKVIQKKESKKAPQKTLKEKREEKKNKKKTTNSNS